MLAVLPENELTEKIIGLAIEVHRAYGGPGLKENAYEAALAWELMNAGVKVERQKPVPIVYKGMTFNQDDEYPKRLDLLVEDRIVVECKSVAEKARDEVFRAQCRTYLRMLNLNVGLVINFGRPTLKEGIDRVINIQDNLRASDLRSLRVNRPEASRKPMAGMVLSVLLAVLGFCCVAEADPYVTHGPRLSAEELFTRHIAPGVPGLEGLAEKTKAGDIAGAEKIFGAFVRATVKPEVYLAQERANPPDAKALKSLKKAAEATMDFRLRSCGTPWHFANHRVDWDLNPTYNKYREWTWQLSRHGFLTNLARYYLATGDEKAVTTWLQMLGSWLDQAQLPPDGTSAYATHCWRNIEAGIRMPGWLFQLHAFIRSPQVTDHFLTAFYRSLWEHGHRIRDVKSFANWRQHELMGLVCVSEFAPFFVESKAWREYAFGELERTFADQIYPDGFQYELTTGYHVGVASLYRTVMNSCVRLGRPVPPFLRAGSEKLYAVLMPLTMPSGMTPALNDGSYVRTGKVLDSVLGDYPERKDFLWFATQGRKGTKPDYLSTVLPYAGCVLFRTGWTPDAIGAYMDCSPFGSNHQHEDKLNFVLEAYGQRMLVEAGTYDYDTSEMRKYVVSTRGHNTLLVNGQEQRARRTYKWRPEMLSQKADLAFVTTPQLDWCEATYTAGYGPADKKVPLDGTQHTRKTIFRKDVPEIGPFFVIVDRLKAPDDKPRSWQAIWHLATTNCVTTAPTFVADFGKGIGLFGAQSDPKARFVNRMAQKEPTWQGWLPIRKAGPHEHRPIATPVNEGVFVRGHRVMTVLVPFKDGATPVVGVKASTDPDATGYEIVLKNGKTLVGQEPMK